MKWCVTGFVMLFLFAGVQLHAQQPDTNSVESIKAKAEKGDAQSQSVLGAIYELGLRDVTKDAVEAVKWYRKAAEQNSAPAQYELGTCYANGQGVAKDEGAAVKWYLRAADQNLATAQYNLGVSYRDGRGVVKDEAEAVNWFRKAAEQNLAIAQYNLGVCYADGQGVMQDVAEAVKWYRKAAEQNLAYAQSNLGAFYENGIGLAKDYVEAAKWYRKAAEQNYAIAQYNLGVCYSNGQGVDKNEAEAATWYRKAADENFASAQCNLGICYAKGQGVAIDVNEAIKWLRKAAEQGDVLAQDNLKAVQEELQQRQPTDITPTPSDLKNAIISMDDFLGMKDAKIIADVISMKPEALEFRLGDQNYDYSGHYVVMLEKPRKHKNPYFGFGSPETAKLVILENSKSVKHLPDATIWEKGNGFIVLVGMEMEWIYSGPYTIQK